MAKKRKTETGIKVEGLLEISDDDDNDNDKLKEKDKSQPKTLNEKFDSNNILHSLDQQNRSKYDDVLKKYKEENPKTNCIKERIISKSKQVYGFDTKRF